MRDSLAVESSDTPSAAPSPEHTGSTGTRVLGIITIVGMVFVTLSGLLWTAPDVELGERIRPIYVHVPTVLTAYLMFAISAVGSAMWLWKRSAFWDKVAVSAVEVGTLFIGLTLVTGSIWGYIAWGSWWEWDARLTSTLVMFLVYVGYLALRASTPDPAQRATRTAAVGLGAVFLIPVVHKSVEWWNSIHQTATTFGQTDAKIDGLQLFTLFAGMATFICCGAWLLIHRFRLEYLAERAEGVELSDAISQRQAETVSAGRKDA